MTDYEVQVLQMLSDIRAIMIFILGCMVCIALYKLFRIFF